MRHVIVRYRVRPGRAEENEAMIRQVFAELDRRTPAGISYASFKEPDGLGFVHIAAIAGETNPLQGLAAFKAFSADIKDRCEVLPAVVELTPVGAYPAAGGPPHTPRQA